MQHTNLDQTLHMTIFYSWKLPCTQGDRLARSDRELLSTLSAITDRKGGFGSLGDTWGEATMAHGWLMLTVLGGCGV
jgi:DNA invertase Pin-like site-specific DNA recombinase